MTAARGLAVRLRTALRALYRGRPQTESRLICDAQSYWADTQSPRFALNSHWVGSGPFEDRTLWARLGAYHADLARRAWHYTGSTSPIETVVEWGCGGGMNAVALAPAVSRYYGTDISPASLDECARQLALAECHNFYPIPVEADRPEAAVDRIPEKVDLFLCTYVFELLPTPEYGARIVRIAHSLLAPNGVALIQVRYSNGLPEQKSKYRNYTKNLAQMTTYMLDQFWTLCEEARLSPLFVVLHPTQRELHEERYAYFALHKPH